MNRIARRSLIAASVLTAGLLGLGGATGAGASSASGRLNVEALAIRGGTSTHAADSEAGQAQRAARAARTSGGNGINYHNGPVMNSGVNAYIIWYGGWGTDSAQSILPTLLGNLGGSPYFNINTTYYSGSTTKAFVPNKVTLGKQVFDNYSQGKTNLSDGQITTIVSNAISSGALPKDPTGLYFVFTSTDVTKSGFLTQYCGWHSQSSIGGTDIKYSFVGDPGANAACSMQTTKSPNANVGADAMASVIAHELEETATDPDLNAWYDSRGYENGDKCAWTFGTTYSAPNGSLANMKLGGLDFLIQRNWVNAAGGSCQLKY